MGFEKAYFLQIPFCSYCDPFFLVVVDFIGCTYRMILMIVSISFLCFLTTEVIFTFIHTCIGSVLHIHQPIWPVIDHIGSAFANTAHLPVFSPKQLEVFCCFHDLISLLEVSDC